MGINKFSFKLDDNIIKKIEGIQTLDSESQVVLFNLIDTYIRDAKARKAYS